MSELPPKELSKTFDPAEIEARWYAHWESEGLFRPDRPDAEPWTIVNPPPNVTGKLHIGHALDNTLQDILVRHARLQGKDALWVVGTDHAGIATQMVVERQLMEEQKKRTDFSRDEFVAKVWEWKEESGGEITQQLRRLGCSMDWENERFTMDEGFTKAVTKVFVDLYNEGLIYRDKRLVNWDPGLKTAISDLEVENVEKNSHFWHFSYPLEDGSGAISVATTRPETMLADMAVAVHPDDARYANIVGKNVRLPITGRLVPIITDEHADPELGSGAVKITPGHDFNDFEVGKRAGFKPAEMLNMLDAEAKVVQTSDDLIPDELIGLDRFDARKRVVELIDAAGFLERVEDRVVVTPYGDRSNAVIEPWLTDQWYVDAETLAAPAMAAVRNGDIDIVPKSWEKTFFNWMENIQPWCVSRQLWWGHRIPAWYGPDNKNQTSPILYYPMGETTDEPCVASTADGACQEFATRLGFDVESVLSVSSKDEADLLRGNNNDIAYIWQDADVLDTWFSSALWPFATIGWPEETDDLKRHYPNDILISGFDILFFWDARMMMQGLHFMGEAPFKTLYLHGLVRAADGQKMSKSKGNTADPLELIDKYGADALRFFMAAMESQGRDIKMDEARLAGYRNFATKLWNAARFCQANGIGASETIEAPEASLPVNRWIISETVETLAKLNKALADLRFDGAADALYHFVWDRFCDWYLELIKPVLQGDGGKSSPLMGEDLGGGDPSASDNASSDVTPTPPHQGEGGDEETRAVAGWVFDQILVMLHPFMPFITEELWSKMGDRGNYPLITAKWPITDARAIDEDAVKEVDWVIGILGGLRSTRSESSIPPGLKITVNIDRRAIEESTYRKLIDLFTKYGPTLSRIGKLEAVIFFNTGTRIHLASGTWEDRTEIRYPVPETAVSFGHAGVSYLIALEGLIDLDAEKARLAKSLEAAEKEAASLDKRLSNQQFIEKAKPEAVEKARADHAEKALEAERLKAALARLG